MMLPNTRVMYTGESSVRMMPESPLGRQYLRAGVRAVSRPSHAGARRTAELYRAPEQSAASGSTLASALLGSEGNRRSLAARLLVQAALLPSAGFQAQQQAGMSLLLVRQELGQGRAALDVVQRGVDQHAAVVPGRALHPDRLVHCTQRGACSARQALQAGCLAPPGNQLSDSSGPWFVLLGLAQGQGNDQSPQTSVPT